MPNEKRGFASMDKERQRQIASQGGKAAHSKGTAHRFTSEEAQAAGYKGGQARSANAERRRQEGKQESHNNPNSDVKNEPRRITEDTVRHSSHG